MDIQLGRSKVVRRAYGIDEIALVPGGRTVDPEVTNTSWSLGGIEREIPIIASAMDGVVDVVRTRWPFDRTRIRQFTVITVLDALRLRLLARAEG